MTDTWGLVFGLVFGSIGLGYFIYGKRQTNMVARYSGIALMVYPYFVGNKLVVVLVGAALMALPFFLEL